VPLLVLPRSSPGATRSGVAPAATLRQDALVDTVPIEELHSPRRSQISLVAGIALITGGLIFTGLSLLEKADHNRRVEVEVRQVEAHANRIRSLEWKTKARGEISFVSQTEFQRVEDDILRITRALAEEKGHSRHLEELRDTCADYLANVNRELALVRTGQFDQARVLDVETVDPSFHVVQELVEQVSEEQGRAAERTVATSRIGLIVAALFSTAMILIYFQRITVQRRRADVALAERTAALNNEGRFRTLTENSADIIMITDAQGTITYMSPSVEAVVGWKNRTLVGRNVAELIHEEDAALVQAALAAVVAREGSSTIEFRMRHDDGRWLDFSSLLRNLANDPNIKGLLFNARDITNDKRTQEVVDFNASHDVLTRLPNRAVFMDRLQMVLDRKKRHPETHAALLFLDLDDLKVVNETLGHDAGDVVIVEFGQRLRACVREVDTVARPRDLRLLDGTPGTIARFGGDEFIVLLEDVSDPSDAIRVAQRIQEMMKLPFLIYDQPIFKSVSIGISFTSEDTDVRTMLANADVAMYRAKTNGKSRFEVYDEATHAQITRRLDMEQALRTALENNQFRVHYQPIVSLATGRIAGREALVRWERPGAGLVSPAAFIPMAEEIGLIVELGRWVLVEACRQTAKWTGTGFEAGPYVSVNVSARQFAYPAFVEHVRSALRETGLDPHRLKVELTEGTAMIDPERALDVMLELAEMGVTLSLDDFGTGYSSLSALRRFPVRTIKIDRSFVSSIHVNSQLAAIVTTICGLARILCMEVVAEGLENVEQLAKLKAISCDFAQGYLLSKPLVAESIAPLLGVDLLERMETERTLADNTHEERAAATFYSPPAIEGTSRTSSPSWKA
jgi:PAS domain S-box-containing protein